MWCDNWKQTVYFVCLNKTGLKHCFLEMKLFKFMKYFFCWNWPDDIWHVIFPSATCPSHWLYLYFVTNSPGMSWHSRDAPEYLSPGTWQRNTIKFLTLKTGKSYIQTQLSFSMSTFMHSASTAHMPVNWKIFYSQIFYLIKFWYKIHNF